MLMPNWIEFVIQKYKLVHDLCSLFHSVGFRKCLSHSVGVVDTIISINRLIILIKDYLINRLITEFPSRSSNSQYLKKFSKQYRSNTYNSEMQHGELATTSGVASYGALGHMPPSTSNNFSFSSLWSKSDSQLSKYCVVCEMSWCRCQQLTAISHKTTSHLAAAAPGLEVHRECPMTLFPALPLLATNPGDATGIH